MTHYRELNSTASQVNYEAFDQHLQQETNLLEEWFLEQYFTERELAIGCEIEFFLMDEHYDPLPQNLSFIDSVNQPFLVPEVGAAHLEINTNHFNLYGDCFSQLHNNILDSWHRCFEVAHRNNYHLAFIGTLPTASEKFHQHRFLTNKPRYHLIDSCIAAYRNGKPLQINLQGDDSLLINSESIAINGLISALQLHIQVGCSQSVQFYNVAQAIAGPMLALSANGPFLFNQQIWSETRITSFEQAMTVNYFDRSQGFKCCLFGTHYLRDSFFELFDQNYRFFPRILPEVFADFPPEVMFHVRRQNGVVYRWNRPVIDFCQNLKPHLRIEHRGPSSGPTIIDMIANAVFFYGLLSYFTTQPTRIDYLLPFYAAKTNFFKAARFGLNAQFKWFSNKEVGALQLLNELLPLAYKGLEILDIFPADIERYLGVIKQRLNAKINGSLWQIRFIEKHGKDFYNMMEHYLENQYQDRPISEWKL